MDDNYNINNNNNNLHRTDAQMSNRCVEQMNRCADDANSTKSLQMAVQKVKVAGDQTNKLLVKN